MVVRSSLREQEARSAEEVYVSLHGATIALLVVSVLHALSPSGLLGIITAAWILWCANRPGPVGIAEQGAYLRCMSITTALVASISCAIVLIAAVYTRALMPPISEACHDCQAEGSDPITIPFSGGDAGDSLSLESLAAPFGQAHLDERGGAPPDLERVAPSVKSSEGPFLGLARSLFAAAAPLTPIVLGSIGAQWEAAAPAPPQAAVRSDAAGGTAAAAAAVSAAAPAAAAPLATGRGVRRRLRTCVPESGPLEGQHLTREQCDELLDGTWATFSWCLFNFVFELAVCIFAVVVAYKVTIISSLIRPAIAPFDESSTLMNK